jgi:hypothetical protein
MPHTNTATEKLNELFRDANISKIIFVDDDFDAEEDTVVLSGVIASVSDGDYAESTLKHLDSFGMRVFDATGQPHPGETIDNEIRTFWDNANESRKKDLCDAIGMPDTRQETKTVSHKLREIVVEIEVECLSVETWDGKKQDLLDLETEGNPNNILIFFDRNLKYTAYGEDGGNTLVKEVLESKNKSLLPGVFTGEVVDANGELEKTIELSRQGILAPVIGKHRTNGTCEFYQGIELFLMLNALDELKRIIVDTYCNTGEVKRLFMEEADYNVVHGAVQGARNEGVFLGDELHRILKRFHFENYEDLIRDRYAHSRKAKLLNCLENVLLSDILQVPAEKVNEVRRRDIYVDAARLSESGVPIEIGDVFEITDANGKASYFILLSQPCSLVVRSNGKRQGNPKSLTLVQIKEGEADDKQEKAGRIYRDSVSVIAGWANSYIDFGEQLHLPPWLLDLCVFNSGGCSRLVAETAQNPKTVEPGWGKLLEKLKKHYTQQVEAYTQLIELLPPDMDTTNKEALEKALFAYALGISNAQIKIEMLPTDGVSFGIKRISRLRESHSHGLLTQYARYQSRPGYPAPLLGGA